MHLLDMIDVQTVASMVRLAAVIMAVAILVYMTFMILRRDRSQISVSFGVELLGHAGYRLMSGIVFAWTTLTGSFMIAGISAWWYYTITDIVTIVPLIVLFRRLQIIFKRGSYETHMLGLASALSSVRAMRSHGVHEFLPDDFQALSSDIEDKVGNLLAGMEGVKHFYERKNEVLS